MNLEWKSFEGGGEPIPFSPDFAGRVLAEAKRRRIASRRRRAFSAGAVLLLAVAVVGLRPMHPRHAPAGPEIALLAMGDLNAADTDVAAEEEVDADPSSYFVADADAQADDEDDSGFALFNE